MNDFEILEMLVSAGGATIVATDSSLYGPMWVVTMRDGRRAMGHTLMRVVKAAIASEVP
jgi:hypothetical protein